MFGAPWQQGGLLVLCFMEKRIMCKITHAGIRLSITDGTEMCHVTRLVFRHAFIVIVVTHTHTCYLCSRLEVRMRVVWLGRRKMKRMRIYTCKKMDQPVKKTKADRGDFAIHSISFNLQHVVLAPHLKTNVIFSCRRQWTCNLEIQDCSGSYMSVW